MKKFIVAIIVFLLVTVLAYVILMQKKNKDFIQQYQVSNIDGWKTYANEAAGIFFQYPADWEVEGNQLRTKAHITREAVGYEIQSESYIEKEINVYDKNIYFTLNIPFNNINELYEWNCSLSEINGFEGGELTLGNNLVHLCFKGPEGITQFVYIFSNIESGTAHVFRIMGDKEEKIITEKILATVSFVE